MNKCCGNCRFSEYEKETDDFICTNDESDNFSDYVDYRESCEEHQEKPM